MGIDTKFLLFVTFFPLHFVKCALFQLHHRDAGLALTVAAQPEALHLLAALEELMHGGADNKKIL